jgi:tetratricopeptide (TPR) repeat protein
MSKWVSELFKCDDVVELLAESEYEGMAVIGGVLQDYTGEQATDLDPAGILCAGLAAVLMAARAFGVSVGKLPAEVEAKVARGDLYFGPGDIWAAARVIEQAQRYVEESLEASARERRSWQERLAPLEVAFARMLREGVAMPGVIGEPPAPGTEEAPVVEEGEVVGIPVGADAYALAKVVFVSRHWRRLIVIGVSDAVVSGTDALPAGPRKVRRFMNTVDWGLRAGAWRRLGVEPLGEADAKGRTWIDGGQIWSGDQRVRHATPDDYAQLPQRRALHDFAAEVAVRVLVGRGTQHAAVMQAECYHLRGLHFLERGERKKAMEHFARASEIDPKLSLVYPSGAKGTKRSGRAKGVHGGRTRPKPKGRRKRG